MRERRSPLWPMDPSDPGFFTRVIGHRGLPGETPENTLASIRAAARAGADIVEVDVKTTRDGTLVLMHDQTVDRTTNGSGAVADLTLAEVRALHAMGEPVPTLEEALALVDIPLMVDYDQVREARALVPVLRDRAVRQRVMLTGDSAEGHALLREAYPDLAIAFSRVGASLREGFWAHPARIGAQYVNPYHLAVRAPFVTRARERGFGVSTWTVDRAARMRRLLTYGIDLLITNRTDVAVRVRSELRAGAVAAPEVGA